jgi:YihY family inner membrane protein
MHRPAATHASSRKPQRSALDAARREKQDVAASKSPRRPASLSLFRDAWLEYERDRAHYLAMAIIYYASITFVPILLLLLSTLGLLLRFSTTAVEIEQRTLLAIQAQAGAQLAGTINRLLEVVQRDSITATVVSVVGILVSASLLFRQLRMTFRAVWNYEPPLVAGPIYLRVLTLLREWIIAFVITLGGGGLIMVALAILTALKWVDRLLAPVPFIPHGAVTAALSSFVIAAIVFGALLKVLPPRPVRWRDLWMPVLLCAGVWVAASELLPLYNRFFGGNRNAYNAIGALLPLLISINVGTQMLFYGAELCKVTTLRGKAPLAIAGP